MTFLSTSYSGTLLRYVNAAQLPRFLCGLRLQPRGHRWCINTDGRSHGSSGIRFCAGPDRSFSPLRYREFFLNCSLVLEPGDKLVVLMGDYSDHRAGFVLFLGCLVEPHVGVLDAHLCQPFKRRNIMTDSTNNKPIDRIRLGRITASIWKYTSNEGNPFYKFTIDSSY